MVRRLGPCVIVSTPPLRRYARNSIKLRSDRTRCPVDTIHPQHAPPVPACMQLLPPIAVGRSSLRCRPHQYLLTPRLERASLFFPGSPRLPVLVLPLLPWLKLRRQPQQFPNRHPLRRQTTFVDTSPVTPSCNLVGMCSHSSTIQDTANTPPRYHTPCHLVESDCTRSQAIFRCNPPSLAHPPLRAPVRGAYCQENCSARTDSILLCGFDTVLCRRNSKSVTVR